MLSNPYLQALGIQSWQSSYTLPGSKKETTFEAYALCDVSNFPVAKLCLEALPIPPSQTTPFDTLLNSMLSAIQLKRVSLSNQRFPDFELILLMGESLAQKALNSNESLEKLRTQNPHKKENIKFIVTHHPLDLLQTPAYKKEAWEDLKLFKSCIH